MTLQLDRLAAIETQLGTYVAKVEELTKKVSDNEKVLRFLLSIMNDEQKAQFQALDLVRFQ